MPSTSEAEEYTPITSAEFNQNIDAFQKSLLETFLNLTSKSTVDFDFALKLLNKVGFQADKAAMLVDRLQIALKHQNFEQVSFILKISCMFSTEA